MMLKLQRFNKPIGKIYSQLLVNRLTKWSEKEEKLNNTQSDFQKGKSTIDCIF